MINFLAILALTVNIQSNPSPETMAVVPTILFDGTSTAQKTALDVQSALISGAGVKLVAEIDVKYCWEVTLKKKPFQTVLKAKDYYPDLPKDDELLLLGKTLKVDYVTACRVRWATSSKWVMLGPKTKATCVVDTKIINVATESVILRSENIVADSTRIEKGWETAASVLISSAFTMVSGGPKTPHQQKAAEAAISISYEPWIKERVSTGKLTIRK